jgi:hypothetical protein
MPEQIDTTVAVAPEGDEHFNKYGVTAEEAEQAREAHARRAADSPEELAYEAGQVAADDPQARRHGADACPFSPVDHPEERQAWFKGLRDALEEQPSVEDLRAAAHEEAGSDA